MDGSDELFDAGSRARVRRRTQRAYAVSFALGALVSAGLIGGLHHEEVPFLADLLGYCREGEPAYRCEYPPALDWLASLVALCVLGPLYGLLLRRRRIAPTVTCNGCQRRGWILDLDATGGRCPCCGHPRFRYRGLEATGVPVARVWREDDVDGQSLLALGRGQRLL